MSADPHLYLKYHQSLQESLADFKNGDKKQRRKIIDRLAEQTRPESTDSHKHRKVGT